MKRKIYFLLTFLCLQFMANAQFTFNAQSLQRGEYRNGYNKIMSLHTAPAVFVAHRLRLETTYKMDSVKFYMSVQDIRTWGATPSTKLSDNFLSLYEGYVEFPVAKNMVAKAGRQELAYDNARFLGNLDWAVQARSHDFLLFKCEKKDRKLHFGGGYSADNQTLTRSTYQTNNFKEAQFVHYQNKFKGLSYSLIFWNNGLAASPKDSLGNPINKVTLYSQTLGISNLSYQIKKTTLSGFFYSQSGKDVINRTIGAYDASISISYKKELSETKKEFLQLTLGAEMMSGNKDLAPSATRNNAFSPFYGTNHMHNGYMDLFYVGGRNENQLGLNDYFLRIKYQPSSKHFISLNSHYFSTNQKPLLNGVSPGYESALGEEFDLTYGRIINKTVSLQIGYSQFFNTKAIDSLQKVANSKATQNWAYVAVLFRPNNPKRFTGLNF
ncbi:MAG: hypothetical protein H6607_12695 [Flavobacteriales bacterium]|nr:hypothetical protein [Flavobacteriales bacterium]